MPGRSRLSAGMLRPRIRLLATAVGDRARACHLSAIQDATPDGHLFPMIDADYVAQTSR